MDRQRIHTIYKVIQAREEKKNACSPSCVDPSLQCIHYTCKQIYKYMCRNIEREEKIVILMIMDRTEVKNIKQICCG